MSWSKDPNFSREQQDLLTKEVQNYLSYYLSKSSSVIPNPLANAAQLLNLPSKDLAYLVEVHFCLSPIVKEFLESLPQGMRRPVTVTDRPRVVSQQVAGPIDWGATMRLRAISGETDSYHVTRPALRIYDSPENRALRWAVEKLDRLFTGVIGADASSSEIGDAAWTKEVERRKTSLINALRVGWLQSVPLTLHRPDVHTRMRLEATRLPMYRTYLGNLLVGLDRYIYEQSNDAVAELIAKRYFRPNLNWQLFEVAIALGLAKKIADAGGKWSEANLLVGGASRRPFATFIWEDQSTIKLWYQRWPEADVSYSHLRAVMEHHALEGHGSRPDIVIERFSNGERVDLILLELKASNNHGTLAEGVLQLLGYLNDQRWMTCVPRKSNEPFAWLVGMTFEGQFPTAPKKEALDVWIVPDENILDEVFERITSPL